MTGGARSGKSRFAQELALSIEKMVDRGKSCNRDEGTGSASDYGVSNPVVLDPALSRPVVYIATAEARDDEMRRRVELHRASRPESWVTVEAPAGLADAILANGDKAGVILVDCLTVYLSNLMLKVTGDLSVDDNPEIDPSVEGDVIAEIDRVIGAAKSCKCPVIFVTNETGTGLVPAYRLGRLFRDLSGIVNQKVAAAAKSVFMVVCGIPIELRSISVLASDAAERIIAIGG